jgi:S-adenosylmethionine decarboxylase
MQRTDGAQVIQPAQVQGRHWLLDLSDCRCHPSLLEDKSILESQFVRACKGAGMTVVGQVFHQFQPSGVTGVVLLCESHVSVHTWPEQGFVAIDVYVCNHERDNTGRGAALASLFTAAFRSERPQQRHVARASVPMTRTWP